MNISRVAVVTVVLGAPGLAGALHIGLLAVASSYREALPTDRWSDRTSEILRSFCASVLERAAVARASLALHRRTQIPSTAGA
jgi:hypothetical protein